jgi:hypothetical protein
MGIIQLVHIFNNLGDRGTTRRRWSSLALAGLLLACQILIGIWITSANAQSEGTWMPAVLLSKGISEQSGGAARMSYPVLIADEWGGAHALWSTTFDDKATIGDTLFYSFWDGTTWSTPVDVLFTPEKLIFIPQVAVDSTGWLHLTWTDNPLGHVWHAHAPAAEAASVSAWSPPIQVTDDLASGLSIAIDADDVMHLVYCAGGRYGGVYHISSTDGDRWSQPVFVGDLSDSIVEYPECRSGQAVDDRGRLHVVWGQSLALKTPIYYARSEDGGLSWTPPLEVDRKDEKYSGEYGPGRPSILAIGPDEVHLVWFGAPLGQRWHRWSADGGHTWSPAEQMFADLRGFMEPPAMAVDSSGTLHLVSMGWLETEERPFGAFYTHWRDDRWSPLVLIDSGVERVSPTVQSGEGGGEFADLAITQGNELHAVWEIGLTEIWASALRTYAPTVLPGPRPVSQASPTLQVVGSVTAATPTEIRATSVAMVAATFTPLDITSEDQYSSIQAILFSVLPAALLVSLVIVVQSRRRRD